MQVSGIVTRIGLETHSSYRGRNANPYLGWGQACPVGTPTASRSDSAPPSPSVSIHTRFQRGHTRFSRNDKQENLEGLLEKRREENSLRVGTTRAVSCVVFEFPSLRNRKGVSSFFFPKAPSEPCCASTTRPGSRRPSRRCEIASRASTLAERCFTTTRSSQRPRVRARFSLSLSLSLKTPHHKIPSS